MTSQSLEIISAAFRHWRHNRGPRGRIPNALWEQAVSACCDSSISVVAKALRLDYYQLKARVAKIQIQTSQQLSSSGEKSNHSVVSVTCSKIVPIQNLESNISAAPDILEFEDRTGLKMRIRFDNDAAQKVFADFFQQAKR